jgi:hypothetical protein
MFVVVFLKQGLEKKSIKNMEKKESDENLITHFTPTNFSWFFLNPHQWTEMVIFSSSVNLNRDSLSPLTAF